MSNSLPRTTKISLLILSSVFLVSFTGLMLQVTLTRIFSTAIYYHYAFMAISVALFGWGFGGIGLHFLKQKLHAIKLEAALTILLGYSLSMLIYLLTMMQFQFSQNYINLLYVISLIPFFLAGTFMAFFYSEYAKLASKLYLADLAGASCACLLVEPILVFLGAESTVLFLGVVSSVVCIFLASLVNKRKVIAISIVVLVFTCTFFAFNVRSSFIAISNPDKVMFKLLRSRPELKVSFTRWNSFSRVDVVEGFDEPLQAIIYIDAGATTDILKWDGKIESIEYLRDSIDFLPYYLVNNPKTLIIGSGGGRDVLVALVGNSSKITAVELNPIVIEAVQRYKEETADVYNNQKTELYVDEGRSFIKRSNEKFDVITLTLVDSWAAISAGGYALAENYLYTKEAFMDYINHLTDNGLLVMIRWAPEVPRLIATVTEAFAMLGEDIHDVGKHVAVVLHDIEPGVVRALFVLKKALFTQAEAETFLNQTQALGASYHAYYIPYKKDDVKPYSDLFNGSISLEQFYNDFPYRVDAVSDDSPYYFNNEKSMPKTLSGLTMLALSLAVLSIMIPWILGSLVKKGKNLKIGIQGSSNAYRFSLALFILYFSALGIGYILIEVAAVQKFILFLGYPTRSLTVILFSLLLSSGIGSFVSGRLASNHKDITKNITLACQFIILMASIYGFTLPKIFEFFLPLHSTLRIAATVMLVFPLGFCMGMPFPSGIRILHDTSKESIPWIWGINGSMSVLGSVFATINGIFLGFSYAFLFGAVTYFIALLCAVFWMKRRTD